MKDIIEDLVRSIIKADEEAFKRNIETNAIILNSEFDFCNEIYNLAKANMGYLEKYPPMILGKKVFKGKLPKKYTFAVTFSNVESYDEHIANLERENKKLKEKLRTIKEFLGLEDEKDEE